MVGKGYEDVSIWCWKIVILYLMHWFHLEAWNAVHEVKRFMSKASLAHLKAMYHVMTYMLGTPNCGNIF
jgi:hypothetical protein